MGIVGKPVGRFDGDIVFGVAETSKWGDLAEYDTERVTNGVGDDGLGAGATGEKMVAELVNGLAARTLLVAETWWEKRKTEFPLEEGAKDWRGQTVGWVVSGETVERETGHWCEQGWDGAGKAWWCGT